MPLPSDSSLVFRTTDAAKWGIGKGAKLTSVEVDLNFWYLLMLIADLQNNPALPLEIQSISVAAGQMTITLSDGVTQFGPFDLPEQAFAWKDAFVGGATYDKFDIITASDGAYLVLQSHTAASTFDPAANNMSGPLYRLIFPFQNIYDISFFFPGSVGAGLAAGDAMFALRFARDAFLPAGLTGSVAGFIVPPVDSGWSVDIQKNGATIGSFTYDAGASSGNEGFFTLAADTQFNPGDVLSVLRPAAIDAAAKGFTMTLSAKKGTV